MNDIEKVQNIIIYTAFISNPTALNGLKLFDERFLLNTFMEKYNGYY